MCLSHDLLVKDLLPLDVNSMDLFEKSSNGLILCKLINVAVVDSIDERALNVKPDMNVYQKSGLSLLYVYCLISPTTLKRCMFKNIRKSKLGIECGKSDRLPSGEYWISRSHRRLVHLAVYIHSYVLTYRLLYL